MYQCRVKRYVLEEVKNGYKNNLSKNDIAKRIGKIEGTQEEQNQLLKDCMIYVFLDEIFNSNIENRERAINLAIRYLQRNEPKGNIVKEKLLSFYRETSQIEKAKSLAEELLKEEPNNLWTISKYIVLLRIEGKDDEALQFIEEQEEEIKKSPIILNLKYRILLKRNDLNGCVQVIKDNILATDEPIFNVKDRKKFIEQLHRYKGQIYSFDKGKVDENDVIIAINRISKRIKKEWKKIPKQNDESKSNTPKKEKNRDLEIAEKINNLICTKKEVLTAEDINKEAENIENKFIKTIMNFQIQHLYGKDGSKIAKEAKKYLEENIDSNEIEKKALRVLVNFLTSKNGKFYRHNNWTQLQKTYFEKIVNEDKTKEQHQNKTKSDNVK